MLPMDQREGWIWLDGGLVPWPDARLHVLSHGLHYASAVFEGERAYGGRVFALERHGARLARSASLMDLALPFDAAALDAAVEEVVAANGIADGYVRRIAWRGSETLAVGAPANRVHVAIAAWPWGAYFGHGGQAEGVRLAISSWRRPPPDCAPWRAKAAAGYAIGTLARHAALAGGCDDALLLDWRGRLTEATGANLFLVKGRVLHTPTPDCFLDGITRQTVIGLARSRGYEVVERAILPAELPQFDELFLTGSAAEVTPVRAVAEIAYPLGPVTRQLARDYRELVRAAPVRVAA